MLGYALTFYQACCADTGGVGATVATPQGRFLQISVGSYASYGQLTNGTWLGWGGQSGEEMVPAGAHLQVCGGFEYGCALTVNGSIICWGNEEELPIAGLSPSAQFSSISCSDDFLCAIALPSKTVVCFGQQYSSPTTMIVDQLAPRGFYRIGALSSVPCSLGLYSNVMGSISPLCNGFCPSGYYANSTLPPREDCSLLCPQGGYTHAHRYGHTRVRLLPILHTAYMCICALKTGFCVCVCV